MFGDNFKELLAGWVTISSCGGCRDTQEVMNSLPAEAAWASIERLTDTILKRSKGSILKYVPENLKRAEIKRLLIKAYKQTYENN